MNNLAADGKQRELIVAMNEKLNRLIDTEVGRTVGRCSPAVSTQGGRLLRKRWPTLDAPPFLLPTPTRVIGSCPRRQERVRPKVNAADGKVTLKHGPIENLGMSAMTMTFPVEDKASLAKVKESDKVRATFDKVPSAATGRALSQSKSERLPRDGVQNSQQ